MMRNMRRGVPNLFKEGTKSLSGLEAAVLRNIEACTQLADITRTSYGPNGMNKLIINHIEKIFVTSDCMTILKESEIQHPAAKMIILAASMQETEVGDGSNFVIAVAGALLNEAAELVKMGLHPSEIVSGYEKAGKKAIEIMDELTVFEASAKQMKDVAILEKGITSSIAAKQLGNESLLAPLVARACLTVMPKNVYNFNVDNVRVCKILGGSLQDSEVVSGMVIPKDTEGDVKFLADAKIAVFTCSIGPPEAESKGTVLIHNAEELMNFSHSEEKEIETIIKGIKDSGVNCIITGGTVDDMAAHFIEKYKMMCLRISSKFELRRICRSVKARALVTCAAVGPDDLGFCSSIKVREIGGSQVTIFNQASKDDTSVATILLRASTNNILNDVDRAIDDGVNVVKSMCKNSPAKFLAGAGASDIEMARRLAAYGATCTGLEQYSIKKFAEALEVIPRTLAENAGHSAIDIISSLYAAHEKGEVNAGINIEDGKVKDMTKTNILDLASTKKQALTLATDAVTTILRVDQIIQAKQAGGPKLPKQNGNWDDTD